MAMASVFLLGGGWNEDAYPATYGRFAAAAGGARARIACVLVDHPDRDMHYGWARSAFVVVGVDDTFPVFVSPHAPLHRDALDGATGIFVGGGLTPDYYDAIVPSARSWLPGLLEQGLPYAGISAGAMIAARQAIVGGWHLRRGAREVVICSEEVGEERHALDVRPGLGLVPFAVDAHASQYGTPTRLMHAVDAGLVPEGWAIDEETLLESGTSGTVISGLGSAYHVRKGDGDLIVRIHVSGTS